MNIETENYGKLKTETSVVGIEMTFWTIICTINWMS